MRSFLGRDILSLKDFSRDEFFRVFQVADDLRPFARDRRNTDLLKSKTLLTAFYQPSTRTRLSTEAAMHRLGGHVLGFSDAKMTRAGDFYQESIKDTFHMLEYYGDVIAIRHFQQGAPAEAANWASVPIINCGDGWGEHPTQVLTDLYTILHEKGTLDGLTYLLVGDMRMRTMHSILYALSQFDAEAIVVGPPDMACCPSSRRSSTLLNVAYRGGGRRPRRDRRGGHHLHGAGRPGRLHRSRASSAATRSASRRPSTAVTRELLREKAKRSSIILHSLPRMDELPARRRRDAPPALLGRGVQRRRAAAWRCWRSSSARPSRRAAAMQTDLRGRDLISLQEWTREEIETVLDVALAAQAGAGAGDPAPAAPRPGPGDAVLLLVHPHARLVRGRHGAAGRPRPVHREPDHPDRPRRHAHGDRRDPGPLQRRDRDPQRGLGHRQPIPPRRGRRLPRARSSTCSATCSTRTSRWPT